MEGQNSYTLVCLAPRWTAGARVVDGVDQVTPTTMPDRLMHPGSTGAAERVSPCTTLVFEPVLPEDGVQGTISARRFHRCMLALERIDAASVPLPFLLAGAVCAPGPAPGVLISFDEARSTVLTVASDILVQAGYNAVVFVATDQIGAPGYLCADQIRVLLGMGVVVGSRGCAGEDLRELALPVLRRELGASRQLLRRLVGYEVRLLALPGGRADPRVMEEARPPGSASRRTS